MKKGFTLIELLVVVAIISLLSSIVFASLNSARGRARNANRQQSVNQLVNAFNLSLTNNFPTAASWVCVSDTCSSTDAGNTWNAYANSGTATHTFLSSSFGSQRPSDPAGGNKVYYGYTYINPFTIGGVSGAWLRWTYEQPSSNCGPGVQLDNQAAYRDCVLKLD